MLKKLLVYILSMSMGTVMIAQPITLFIGIDIAGINVSNVQQYISSKLATNFKPEQHPHSTLAYLGQLDARVLQSGSALSNLLFSVAQQATPFLLQVLKGTKAHLLGKNALIVPLHDATGQLAQMAKAIRQNPFIQEMVPNMLSFQPHSTLGRITNPQDPLVQKVVPTINPPTGTATINKIILFQAGGPLKELVSYDLGTGKRTETAAYRQLMATACSA